MAIEFSDAQRAILRTLCDTFVPAIDRAEDPHGLWARSASAIGVDQGVEQILLGLGDPAIQTGLLGLLDVLADQGLARAPSQASREQLLRNMTLASADAAAGLGALAGMTLFLTYGAPDPATGFNPNWAAFGYAGPATPVPDTPKEIHPLEPSGDPPCWRRTCA